MPAAERLELECGRIAPIDDVSGGADPHRRDRGAPRRAADARARPRARAPARPIRTRPGRPPAAPSPARPSARTGRASGSAAATPRRVEVVGLRLGRPGRAAPRSFPRPSGRAAPSSAPRRHAPSSSRPPATPPAESRALARSTPATPPPRQRPRRPRPRQQHPVRRVQPAEPHEPCGGTQQERAAAERERGPAQEGADPERAREALEREVGGRRRHPPYPTA